ncbi:MAG TPA: hypothetical protein VIV11_00480 [Kofleriaceae bacterium]
MRCLAIAGVLFANTAAAQSPGVYQAARPAYAQPETEQVWYGWKIALSDTVAWGAMLGAIAWDESTDSPDDEDVNIGAGLLVLGGMAWFEFGAPLVHLTERNVSGAALSFGMRFTFPLVGALVGHAFDDPNKPDDPIATLGMVAGALTASAADILLVANTRRRARTVWPQLAVGPGGFQLGASGAF